MNTTAFSNITGFQGLAFYTNNATGGLLFTGGLIILFIVSLIVLMRNESENFLNSFTVASWSFFIIGLFMWFAALVPTILVIGFLIASAVGTFLLYATP